MKKFLCVVLTLTLALSALAGCGGKDDPQSGSESSSQPESSQAAPERIAPEPIAPEPIMPVPEQDPEPEPEDDPEPEEDEEPAEDEEDEDGEDEEGDEEDEEDEEDGEDDGLDELGIPAVPHGEDIEWLDFTTVTEEELKPLLDKVLARAEYFCRYGLNGKFTEAGPDKSKAAAIERPYRNNDNWIYHPYTNLPYNTVDELQEAMTSVFTWEAVTSEMHYAIETKVDDEERIYYADEVVGFSKARDWDTSRMKIRSASEKRLTLRMPTHWGKNDFDADLTLQIVDGYLVVDNSYFAVTEEDRAKRVIQ